MDQAATTPDARNYAVRQHRRWRGGKWRTFAAGGALRGAPRIQGRPHHARLPVRARSRRAAAMTPSGPEPSPALAPADSSRTFGDPHAAGRDHSRTHAATVHPGLEAHPTLAAVLAQAHGRPHHARLPVSAWSRRAAATTPSGPEPSLAPTPADSSCTLGIHRAAGRDHSRTHAATVHPGLEAHPTLAAVPRRAHGRPHHARLPVSTRSRRAAAATPSGHEPSLARAPADSSRAIGNPHAACRDHSRGTIPPPETRNGADPKADPVEECGGSPADSCQLLTLVVY